MSQLSKCTLYETRFAHELSRKRNVCKKSGLPNREVHGTF